MSDYAKIEVQNITGVQANALVEIISALPLVGLSCLSFEYTPTAGNSDLSANTLRINMGGSALYSFRASVNDIILDELDRLPDVDEPVDMKDSRVRTKEDL